MAKFDDVQRQMTQFLRDPEQQTPPDGIETRRLKVYQELIYNNIENFISNGFPVLRTLLDDETWHFWVRRFIKEHQCHSPLFLDISQEFLQFIESLEQELPYPFMLELAHYEWVELALWSSTIDESYQLTTAFKSNAKANLSQNAWLLAYSYPVHQISTDYIPKEPAAQPVTLMVYRNKQDQVKFSQLTPATFALGQLIEAGEMTLGEIIKQLAQQMRLEPAIVEAEVKNIISDWSEKGIILSIE